MVHRTTFTCLRWCEIGRLGVLDLGSEHLNVLLRARHMCSSPFIAGRVHIHWNLKLPTGKPHTSRHAIYNRLWVLTSIPAFLQNCLFHTDIHLMISNECFLGDKIRGLTWILKCPVMLGCYSCLLDLESWERKGMWNGDLKFFGAI